MFFGFRGHPTSPSQPHQQESSTADQLPPNWAQRKRYGCPTHARHNSGRLRVSDKRSSLHGPGRSSSAPDRARRRKTPYPAQTVRYSFGWVPPKIRQRWALERSPMIRTLRELQFIFYDIGVIHGTKNRWRTAPISQRETLSCNRYYTLILAKRPRSNSLYTIPNWQWIKKTLSLYTNKFQWVSFTTIQMAQTGISLSLLGKYIHYTLRNGFSLEYVILLLNFFYFFPLFQYPNLNNLFLIFSFIYVPPN